MCKSCRSRKTLQNEYFLAKIGFDTADIEPSKICRYLPTTPPTVIYTALLALAADDVVGEGALALAPNGDRHGFDFKEVALENMPKKFETPDTFQPLRPRLKAVAFSNVRFMILTRDTSQLPRLRSNCEAM